MPPSIPRWTFDARRAEPSTVAISTSPSTTGAPADVPIAVIVGATVAGMVLAFTLMMAWVYGSRVLKRKRAQQTKKVNLIAATRDNTLKNGAKKPSMRRAHSVPPPLVRAQSGRVTFASNGSDREQEKDESVLGRTMYNLPEPSLPRPLRPAKSVEKGAQSEQPHRDASSHEKPLLERSIMHKPSTVSSASWYSTESGEERQMRPPASFIRAAFSRMGRGVEAAIINNRDSAYSNIGDERSRSSRPGQEQQTMLRVSQATSISAYSQTEEGGGGHMR